MRAPPSSHRRLARLAPWLLAIAPLACGSEESVEPDDRVAVKLTLDPVVYLDGAASQRKMLERVKNETRSIFPALRRADVLVLSNQQVDVDTAQIKKESVTFVDPATGITRPGTRVRFHYVTLAQVPRALADKSGLALGVLHSPDGAHAEAVLTECSATGDRERQAASELWTVFDASLPTCADAMAREHAAIAAARKKLAHPDREIVPAEIDRVYVPLVVRLKRRQPSDAGAAPVQGPGEHADDPRVKARSPGGVARPAASGEQPDFVIISKEDKDREREFEDEEDEKELRKQARAMGGDIVGPTAPPSAFGSSPYLAPNYAVLYLAIIAFVVLLVGQTRRRKS